MRFSKILYKSISQLLICLIVLLTASCNNEKITQENPKNSDATADIPYYFYAIHIEPYNRPTQRQEIEKHYPAVRQMVTKADSYNMKLTLMFAASWVDYILEDPVRIAALETWKKSGHEIAIHHHAITHGMQRPGSYLEDWDGYTFLPEDDAIAHRNKLKAQIGKTSEPYQGTLNDLIDKLKLINADIKSGCTNIGASRKPLPDAIIYDTCAQLPFFEEEVKPVPGFVLGALGGQNKFITAGTYNGIERKFLTHYFMNSYLPGGQTESNLEQAKLAAKKAETAFRQMGAGVYGTVNHGEVEELEVFSLYLDFLHTVDPKGKKSKTVSEIIEGQLIPEKRIPDALMNHNDDWTGFQNNVEQ